jgi:hypothetical protein
MNYIANILTASRFLFAVGMVLAAPFSPVFWVCYLGGGVSAGCPGQIRQGDGFGQVAFDVVLHPLDGKGFVIHAVHLLTKGSYHNRRRIFSTLLAQLR